MGTLNDGEKQDVQRRESTFQASGMASAETTGSRRTQSVPETHRCDGGAESVPIGVRGRGVVSELVSHETI